MSLITQIRRTCIACPSQWEGKLNNGNHIYIRYRWGDFTIGEGKTINEAVNNQLIHVPYGDSLDGFMCNKTMVELIHETDYKFTKEIEQCLIQDEEQKIEIDPDMIYKILNIQSKEEE